MIRRARRADHDWIRNTAQLVYQHLGEYGPIIGSWLGQEGVMTFVDRTDDRQLRRGFILLGFYAPAEAARGECIADLLAIAVSPEFQRQGVGRGLLAHAVQVARDVGTRRAVPEMRLTVAHDNPVAQRMFAGVGFTVIERDYGNYDGGQRAIRMSLALAL